MIGTMMVMTMLIERHSCNAMFFEEQGRQAIISSMVHAPVYGQEYP